MILHLRHSDMTTVNMEEGNSNNGPELVNLFATRDLALLVFSFLDLGSLNEAVWEKERQTIYISARIIRVIECC